MVYTISRGLQASLFFWGKLNPCLYNQSTSYEIQFILHYSLKVSSIHLKFTDSLTLQTPAVMGEVVQVSFCPFYPWGVALLALSCPWSRQQGEEPRLGGASLSSEGLLQVSGTNSLYGKISLVACKRRGVKSYIMYGTVDSILFFLPNYMCMYKC